MLSKLIRWATPTAPELSKLVSSVVSLNGHIVLLLWSETPSTASVSQAWQIPLIPTLGRQGGLWVCYQPRLYKELYDSQGCTGGPWGGGGDSLSLNSGYSWILQLLDMTEHNQNQELLCRVQRQSRYLPLTWPSSCWVTYRDFFRLDNLSHRRFCFLLNLFSPGVACQACELAVCYCQ